jgi:hypothetical protein
VGLEKNKFKFSTPNKMNNTSESVEENTENGNSKKKGMLKISK